MSTGTIRDAVRWCLGCCRSRATGRWTNCGGAGDGGGRRTVWGRRRGRKSSSRTRRRTKQPCPGGRCTARGTPRGRRWPLALAAALVVVTAGVGSAWWAYRTIEALGADRDRLAAHVAALEDTVSSFIHDPATRLIQVPVSTGGRVGSLTIFADSVRHRWLVRCDGLAPNASDQAYQL